MIILAIARTSPRGRSVSYYSFSVCTVVCSLDTQGSIILKRAKPPHFFCACFHQDGERTNGRVVPGIIIFRKRNGLFSVPTSNVIMKTKSFEGKWRHTQAFCKFLAIFSQIIETVNLRVFIHLCMYLLRTCLLV